MTTPLLQTSSLSNNTTDSMLASKQLVGSPWLNCLSVLPSALTSYTHCPNDSLLPRQHCQQRVFYLDFRIVIH